MSKSNKKIETTIIFSQSDLSDMSLNGTFNTDVPIIDMASTMAMKTINFLKLMRKNKQSIGYKFYWL